MKRMLSIISALWEVVRPVCLLLAAATYLLCVLLILSVIFIITLPFTFYQVTKERAQREPEKRTMPPLGTLDANDFLGLSEGDIQQKFGIQSQQSGMLDHGQSLAQWLSEDGTIECWFQSEICYDCTFLQNGREIARAHRPRKRW
ncbi:hypothetical protein [Intestinirhabdus alba]|jgi:hypothetical protein|uniref:Uncharacterized protein n=1 Tax=Intestinirhabdus alba TaxID=2899544 RepID=A0A6L6IH04_9ENTR|nr:hypothetical protein [Intestinirhabdus alba]MTH45224.1 hypothetical protein [Intestinirhabdus alba]